MAKKRDYPKACMNRPDDVYTQSYTGSAKKKAESDKIIEKYSSKTKKKVKR